MAVTRRKQARAGRKGAIRRRDRIKVSFIGEEIEKAIDRISREAEQLPGEGQDAVRIAILALKGCSLTTKSLVRCKAWFI